MISGLNDSKKHFIIWSVVTILIFIVFSIVLQVFANSTGSTAAEIKAETVVIGEETFPIMPIFLAGLYILATFPMGFYIRGKVMHWYVHIPAEEIKIFESNIILAAYRVIKCEILGAFDLILLYFYTFVSLIFGIAIFPYHIISGIVLICKKEI